MEIQTVFKENISSAEAVESNMFDYIRYANNEILPSCFDGLKLVHRRIIGTLGTSDERMKGSALVGAVMTKLHPHGDSGIYDAAVRMSQPFSQVYPFITVKGNFGAYGGGEAAAGRYLDVQSSPFSKDLFFNKVDMRTLSYMPSETGHGVEPMFYVPIIPTVFLTNAFGVSVAFKSIIPTFNLLSVCDMVERFIQLRQEHPMDYRTRFSEIAKYCVPDFPTHVLIRNEQELVTKYSRGEFNCAVQMDGTIELSPYEIHLRSIPHGSAFENVVKKLGDMMNSANFISANFTEINDLTVGTDLGNLQFKLKRGVDPFKILTELKKHCTFTQSWSPQWVFVDKEGYVVNLNPMELLEVWYLARSRSILGALKFINIDLFKQYRKLTALIIIADHTDEVLTIFKKAENREATIPVLCKKFGLTKEQAEYISSLQLHQITRQGKDELLKSLQTVKEKIENLQHKFVNTDEIILQDVEYMRKTYGPACPRRSEIPNFIGALFMKDSGGIIQFKSYMELAHLFKRWSKHQSVDIIMYPKGTHKLLGHTRGGLVTEDNLDMPKEFQCTKLEVLKNKPRSTVWLKNGLISRVDTLTHFANKPGIIAHVAGGFSAINRDFQMVQMSTTQVPKRNNIEAMGSKTDLLYFNGIQADEVVIAVVNTKSPNSVILQRMKEGDKFKRSLLGHSEIIGMWRYGDPISFTVPNQYLSRCSVKHVLIRKPEAWFGDTTRVEIFMTRRNTSHGKNLSMFAKGADIYSESTIRSAADEQ